MTLGQGPSLPGWPLLLAIGFESIMESDSAPWSMSIERQREKDFRRYSFVGKSRDVIEPELLVILGMAHETTAPSVQAIELG